jgi:hypothetical protein
MSAQNQDAFKYRHMTITPDFHYISTQERNDCPHELAEGRVAYWQGGDLGLKRSSMPKNVSAVYQACSFNKMPQNAEKDNYGLYWPHSDEYYKQQYFANQN